jgi:septum formation protein
LEQDKRIILASNSPRRRELLRLGGWRFDVAPADVNEDQAPGEDPLDYVKRMAISKTSAVVERGNHDAIIIGADTIVVDSNQDGEVKILGKPSDAEEAIYMLRRMRGKTHQVYTAVVVVGTSRADIETDLSVSQVRMRPYSESEITAYIDTGDPFDKAGAYAIQHSGFHPVEVVEGCYANVVGLPLCAVERLLEKFGFSRPTDITQQCIDKSMLPCRVYTKILEQELES